MKFRWPQNEAVIASLRAYALTGETRFAERFALAYDWARAHFPDPEHGEWYGYLHRGGGVSTTLKGNLYKGPFHIPRMYLQWGKS
jgi:N-acylglucosamine 2-epimerase